MVELKHDGVCLAAVNARVGHEVAPERTVHALPVRGRPLADAVCIGRVVVTVNLPLARLAVHLRAANRMLMKISCWFVFPTAGTNFVNGGGC